MKITRIPAQEVDVEAIYTFCKELIAAYETDPIDLDKVLPWCRRKIQATRSEYCRILQNGELTGYLHICPPENGKKELDDFYILPEWRGKGIGSAVLTELCREADEQRETLLLYCFRQNTGAQKLYERFGFAVTATAGGSRVIMEREPK